MIKVNTLDYIIILVMGLYLIEGLLDGLLKQVAGVRICSFFPGALTGANLWNFAYRYALGGAFIEDSSLGVIDEGIPGFDFIPGMSTIVSAVSFVLLFIVLQILIGIIVRKMKSFNRVPLIGPLNRLGGMGIGALKGLLFVFIVLAVVSLLPLEYLGDLVAGSKLATAINQVMPGLFERARIFFLEHYHVVIK